MFSKGRGWGLPLLKDCTCKVVFDPLPKFGSKMQFARPMKALGQLNTLLAGNIWVKIKISFVGHMSH